MGSHPHITVLYGFRVKELDIPTDDEMCEYYDNRGFDMIFIDEDWHDDFGFVAFGTKILWTYDYELMFESLEKYEHRLIDAKHKLNALLSKHPKIRELVKDVEPQVIIHVGYS